MREDEVMAIERPTEPADNIWDPTGEVVTIRRTLPRWCAGSAVSPRRSGLSLACSRFDPWQRGMILIDAIEIDERLASHLVGPDPFLRDQLISLRFSELSIAAPVLKLGQPAPLVLVVVSHGS